MPQAVLNPGIDRGRLAIFNRVGFWKAKDMDDDTPTTWARDSLDGLRRKGKPAKPVGGDERASGGSTENKADADYPVFWQNRWIALDDERGVLARARRTIFEKVQADPEWRDASEVERQAIAVEFGLPEVDARLERMSGRLDLLLTRFPTEPGRTFMEAVANLLVAKRLVERGGHAAVADLIARATRDLSMLQIEAELAQGRTDIADLAPSGGAC